MAGLPDEAFDGGAAAASPAASRGSRRAFAARCARGRPGSGVALGGAKGRNLSQLSHGLVGRYGTMASMSDLRQDADLRIRILMHWPDTRHWSTDQILMAGVPTVGMRMEVWVASPQPAVGGYGAPGTCQDPL